VARKAVDSYQPPVEEKAGVDAVGGASFSRRLVEELLQKYVGIVLKPTK